MSCNSALLRGECWGPADSSAGLSCVVEAGACSFADEGSLVLCERACELVEQSAECCSGVDAFIEAVKVNASCCEVVECAHEVCEGAAEAIDAHDREGVAPSEAFVAGCPLGALHGGSARLLNVDGFTSHSLKRGDLGGWVLVAGADAGVSGVAHDQNPTWVVVVRIGFWLGVLARRVGVIAAPGGGVSESVVFGAWPGRFVLTAPICPS